MVVVLSLVLVVAALTAVEEAMSSIAGAFAGAAGALTGPLLGTEAPSAQSCGKAVGPFTVRGTRVFGAHGKLFVSYGLTIPDMQGPHWANFVSLDEAKIAAIADDWCANTVRFQLDEDNLIGPSGNQLQWGVPEGDRGPGLGGRERPARRGAQRLDRVRA